MSIDPFRLERYFAKYEFKTPYLLCSSDCESITVAELLSFETSASEQLNALSLGYTETQGHPDLRHQIAQLYNSADLDNILVHAGAEEAIFNFMNVTINAGDHIIVHSPCYQSLSEVARSLGADISYWEANEHNHWTLDLAELTGLIKPETKVIVVNFPHNPTGFLPSKEFIHALSKIADDHGLIIFSDEVYRGMEFNDADRLPAMVDVNSSAVSLGVMSKSYGLPGLRIGWIVTQNTTIYDRMAGFKDYTTICNSAPSEFLATLALTHGDKIIRRNLQIVNQNIDLLNDFFAGHQELFSWQTPIAGSIAFPLLRQGNVDKFCHDLAEQSGVLLLPGTLYGDGYQAFRIGFGRANMPEALARLQDHIQRTRIA